MPAPYAAAPATTPTPIPTELALVVELLLAPASDESFESLPPSPLPSPPDPPALRDVPPVAPIAPPTSSGIDGSIIDISARTESFGCSYSLECGLWSIVLSSSF